MKPKAAARTTPTTKASSSSTLARISICGSAPAALSWDVRYGAPGARTGVDAPYPYNTRFFNSTADLGPNGWVRSSWIRAAFRSARKPPTRRSPIATASTPTSTNFAHLAPTSELALEAVYHAPGFDLKYLGGYVWYNYNLQQDQDGTPSRALSAEAPPASLRASDYETERVSDYNRKSRLGTRTR